jgi:hypothetical protein
VSKLPGLNRLVGLAPHARHDANGVLDGVVLHGRTSQGEKKLDTLLLSAVCFFDCKVPCAAYGQMRAWRMRNQQAPALREHRQHIALDVPLRIALAWLKVATPSIATEDTKRIAHAG